MRHPITQKGIGLIEVLITTLVISLGILAIASLQGNLMSSSGSNKTRSEAMQLANQKMEQLRDQIQLTGYNAIASGRETAIIAGTNENFFRYWSVDTLPSTAAVGTALNCGGTVATADTTGPARKKICVNVAWPYSTVPSTNPSPDDDHLVIVQSIIAYDNASYSNMVSDAGSAASNLTLSSPTTNAGSSTVIYDSISVGLTTPGTAGTLSSQTTDVPDQYLKVNPGGTTASVVYKCTGETTSGVIPFIPFEKDLYTRRVHYQPASGSFVEAVELAQSNNDNLFGSGLDSCTRKVRYNGGVIIPIKGRIYSNVSLSSTLLSLLGFDASESGVFCEINPTGLSTSSSVPYYCYVGGNCINGPVGTVKESSSGLAAAITANVTAAAGEKTIVTQCPSTPSPASTDSSIYGPNVYSSIGPGGWRGNVGVIGLADTQSSQTLTTCFSTTATAREYYSLRTNSSVLTNEGINKPYLCHDFLIVNPPNGNSTTLDCSSSSVVGALNLAPNPIIRNFSGTTANNYDSTIDQSHCHFITGTMPTGVTTAPTVTASNGGFECTVSGSNYQCIGSAKVGTSITVASGATTCNVPTLTSSNNYGSSGTTVTCNLGGTVATHTVSGTITTSGTGTTTGLAVAGSPSAGVSSCTVTGSASPYSYSCTVANTWTGSLNASGSCNGSSTSATAITFSTTSTTNQTGQNFTMPSCAASTTTHTISGTITTSGTGATTGVTIAPTVTTSSVSCSVTGTASPYNYSCTADNTWSGSLNASGTCNGASISATALSFGTSTSAQTGSFTLPTCTAPSSYTVSGTISSGNSLVTMPSGCTVTTSAGNTTFSCTVASGGSITVTPNSGKNVCVGAANAGTNNNTIISNVTSNVVLLNFYVQATACP